MLSILHKELEHKVEKFKRMKSEVMQPKIENKFKLSACEYRISSHEVLQLWLL